MERGREGGREGEGERKKVGVIGKNMRTRCPKKAYELLSHIVRSPVH